jgi:aldehyde dehydrogenase (NAD+)
MKEVLQRLGIKEINHGIHDGLEWDETHGGLLESYSPVDGKLIAKVRQASREDYERAIISAQKAFTAWQVVPAPKRGEIVRQIANELRIYKEPLGKLVTYEMGKTYQEGLGEVQEMIDIADYAVGLSRQLYGLTMHSERPRHRMYEQYHPLGVVGVISSFNFPVAVWAWNAMIAMVCGDVVIWKPSSKTPLCAIAVHQIIRKVLKDNKIPAGVLSLVVAGSSTLGDNFLADKRMPLISVTGSVKVGRHVAKIVGERLGRTILELGGNNAIIISQYGNKDMALRGSLFGAIATAGQRCTTTRRLIIHDCVFDLFKEKLIRSYKQVKIGNPLDETTIVGPLVDKSAVQAFRRAQEEVVKEGGKIIFGGQVLEGEGFESGCDALKAYMRRQTNTINFSTELPLAQGIKFDIFEE